MSERSCADPIVEQYNEQGEIDLEVTQSAEAVLAKAEVSSFKVNHMLVKDAEC